MADTITVISSTKAPGRNLSQTTTLTAEKVTYLEESIPDSSTDLELTIQADISEMVAVHIECDQNCTIETNDGSSPTDTISVVANEPVVWNSNKAASDNPFASGDVTSLFVTTGAVGVATLKILIAEDPTP